jgi:hypothetical protein
MEKVHASQKSLSVASMRRPRNVKTNLVVFPFFSSSNRRSCGNCEKLAAFRGEFFKLVGNGGKIGFLIFPRVSTCVSFHSFGFFSLPHPPWLE